MTDFPTDKSRQDRLALARKIVERAGKYAFAYTEAGGIAVVAAVLEERDAILALDPPPEGYAEAVERVTFAARDDVFHRLYGVNEEVTVRRSDLRLILAASSQGGEWRTIDSAPRDGSAFLVSLPQADFHPDLKPTITTMYWASWENFASLYAERLGETEGDCGDWTPTHWMPLPAPPVLSDGEKE